MAVKLYDLKSTVLTVGGILVSGYGEQDAVSFDWAADLVESFETVDGTRVYARTQNRELLVSITLMQTSGAIAQLRSALDLQHGTVSGIKQPVIAPAPLWFYASDNGDFVSGGAVFLNRPNTSRGAQVGEVVFRLSIATPQWQIGGLDFGVL